MEINNILVISKITAYDHYSKRDKQLDSEDKIRIEKSHHYHHKKLEELLSALEYHEINYAMRFKQEFSEKDFSNADLVIALGGDGVFLHTAGYIKDDTPILGIKSDPASVGYLLSKENYSIKEKLGLILEDKHEVVNISRLKVVIDNKIEELVTNEVFFGNKYNPAMSRYEITLREKREEQRTTSGIVISTGTGSTGWYLSIPNPKGQKSFPRTADYAKFIVREYLAANPPIKMICGILGKDDVLKVKSLMNLNGCVSIDGSVEVKDKPHKMFPFDRGSVAEIMMDDKSLRVIEFN